MVTNIRFNCISFIRSRLRSDAGYYNPTVGC
jgi:hypothetical protein